jgi:hypothetical protein
MMTRWVPDEYPCCKYEVVPKTPSTPSPTSRVVAFPKVWLAPRVRVRVRVKVKVRVRRLGIGG